MLKNIAASITLSIAFFAIAAANSFAAAVQPSHASLSAKCNNASERIIKLGKVQSLCIFGSISQNNAKWYIDKIDEVDSIFIDSLGGHVIGSMAIGLKIHDSGKTLYVGTRCFSSCANYIVPASKKIILSDKSIIAFHGTASSAFHEDYIVIPSIKFRDIGISIEDSIISRLNVTKGVNPHEFYDSLENAFFQEIGVDKKYLLEVNELFENIDSETYAACRINRSVALVNSESRLRQYLYKSIIWGNMSPGAELLKAQLPGYDISVDGMPCIN